MSNVSKVDSIDHSLIAAELLEDPRGRTVKASSKTKSKQRCKKSPLVGHRIITYSKGRDERHYQGKITNVVDDMVLVRVIDPAFGLNSTIKAFPKSLIFSDQCDLFEDDESWIRAGREWESRQSREEE